MEKRKGFTLIEVLVVVLILAVLATLVVPRISQSTGSSNDAVDAGNWAMMTRALERYATANAGSYPADQAAFDAAIRTSPTYFPHSTPVCPYGNPYVYDNTAGQQTVVKHAAGN